MKKNKKLIWQLFPPYLVIILLSLLAVYGYAASSLRHFFLDSIAADLKTRALLIENQIADHLAPLDAGAVDTICKQVGKTIATRITVVLPSGKVIGDTRENPARMDNHGRRPEIVQALAGQTGRSMRFSKTLQQQMMYVAIGLRSNQTILAVVRTSIPTTFINRELSEIHSKIALGGLLIALLAAGLSLGVARRLSRPLEQMKKSADRFAAGDLSHRLAVSGSEEMVGLAEALNQMAMQLDQRMQTVINQRKELETVLASMREGLIALDDDERIVSINRAAAELFTCDAAQSQGRNLVEIIRNRALQQFVRRAISQRRAVEDDIHLLQNGEKTLHLHSSPLLDVDKKHIGTLVVFNDVTRLRRLEDMRREFVANVSHELKTPLTAIRGFVETLCQGSVTDPQDIERFLGIIHKHVGRLSAIIDDLLSLSRIEAQNGQEAVRLEEGRLHKVCDAAIQVCRLKADQKKIAIGLDCPPRLIARLDPQLLEQALVNLVDNAIKYSEPGCSVEVTAVQDRDQIRISVVDQGIGIAKKHLPRLFERFYRVDKARSRNQGGTGLGLAIVKHIAQLHGGRVTVESTLGQGSTFSLHLPKDGRLQPP